MAGISLGVMSFCLSLCLCGTLINLVWITVPVGLWFSVNSTVDASLIQWDY